MNRRSVLDLLRSLEQQWPEWLGDDLGEIVPILNGRDAPPFDVAWMECFERLEAKKQANPLTDDIASAIAALRESGFVIAFERWLSHEVAACISDDLGLLGDALALDSSDPWIKGLLQAYSKGRLPSGDLVLIEGRLRALADEVLK